MENAPDIEPMERMKTKNMGRLKAFKNAEKFKKAVLTYMATQLSNKEAQELRKVFMYLDKDKDGKISEAELTEALKEKYSSEEISHTMIGIDMDQSGSIEYNGTKNIL